MKVSFVFLGETIINDYLSFVEVGFKYNLQSLKEELKRLQTEKTIKTPKHGLYVVARETVMLIYECNALPLSSSVLKINLLLGTIISLTQLSTESNLVERMSLLPTL